MITWIVLGSSPLAREAYQWARFGHPTAPVVTCNRGIELESEPDFYFLSDAVACETWADRAKEVRRNNKTKLVTLRREPAAMKMRKVDDFDLVVREGHPYEPFQLSGMWCVEFAIRVGCASRVVLCGMDGYRGGLGAADYFPGSTVMPTQGEDRGPKLVKVACEPLAGKLASKYPQVNFFQIGTPCYRINRANWSIQEIPEP